MPSLLPPVPPPSPCPLPPPCPPLQRQPTASPCTDLVCRRLQPSSDSARWGLPGSILLDVTSGPTRCLPSPGCRQVPICSCLSTPFQGTCRQRGRSEQRELALCPADCPAVSQSFALTLGFCRAVTERLQYSLLQTVTAEIICLFLVGGLPPS